MHHWPRFRVQGVTELEVDAETAAEMVEHPVVAGVRRTDEDVSAFVDPDKGASEKGASDFGSKGYDFLWVTPGEQLSIVEGAFRTSHIVDPPNGQLSFTQEMIRRRREQVAGAAKYLTGEGPFNGPEDTALSERCVVGFGGGAGHGMLHPIYNNNYQFV